MTHNPKSIQRGANKKGAVLFMFVQLLFFHLQATLCLLPAGIHKVAVVPSSLAHIEEQGKYLFNPQQHNQSIMRKKQVHLIVKNLQYQYLQIHGSHSHGYKKCAAQGSKGSHLGKQANNSLQFLSCFFCVTNPH